MAGSAERDGRDLARPGLVVLTEFAKSDGLGKHARAVEASMRAYAGRYDEDPEAWGIAGVPHGADADGTAHRHNVEALDPSWNPRFREEAPARGFRSLVQAPMLRGDDVVGVIAVTRGWRFPL